jgi:phage N-6-adenine-methyltransferase
MRLFDVEHEMSNDDWWTPPYIFVALDLTFDIDVAAPPGGVPYIPATRHYSINDDGLTQPWAGRIWCNPPYSQPAPWLHRMAEHRNGIAMLPADTSTDWWHQWATTADEWCFLRRRVRFVKTDTSVGGGRFPSVLVAWGTDNADALRSSNLGWCPSRTSP